MDRDPVPSGNRRRTAHPGLRRVPTPPPQRLHRPGRRARGTARALLEPKGGSVPRIFPTILRPDGSPASFREIHLDLVRNLQGPGAGFSLWSPRSQGRQTLLATQRSPTKAGLYEKRGELGTPSTPLRGSHLLGRVRDPAGVRHQDGRRVPSDPLPLSCFRKSASSRLQYLDALDLSGNSGTEAVRQCPRPAPLRRKHPARPGRRETRRPDSPERPQRQRLRGKLLFRLLVREILPGSGRQLGLWCDPRHPALQGFPPTRIPTGNGDRSWKAQKPSCSMRPHPITAPSFRLSPISISTTNWAFSSKHASERDAFWSAG